MIVQDDRFDATGSITICAFMADDTQAPLFRLAREPSAYDGLRSTCRLMVDKITKAPKSRIGTRVGRLDDEGTVLLNLAMLVFGSCRVAPSGKICGAFEFLVALAAANARR